MSNEAKTQSALMVAADEFLSSGDLPTMPIAAVAWENRNFDASENSPWAAVFYVPNQPTSRTIGVSGIDEINGFMQIDINIPTNTGFDDLRQWERKARLFFVAGNRFEYDGQSVLITSCGMGQGRTEGNFYRKSITIAFRSQLKRSPINH